MSIDKNSPQYRKGKLGERIIIEQLQKWGNTVTRPDGSSPYEDSTSLMDFKCVPANGHATWYAECKTRSDSMQYAYGSYPCYTIPVKRFEQYKEFCNKNDSTGFLYIINIKAAAFFEANIFDLDVTCTINGKIFPFDQKGKTSNQRHFHQEQFEFVRDLTDAELAEFKAIDDSNSDSALTDNTQPNSSPVAEDTAPVSAPGNLSSKELIALLAATVDLPAETLAKQIIDYKSGTFTDCTIALEKSMISGELNAAIKQIADVIGESVEDLTENILQILEAKQSKQLTDLENALLG